MTCPVVLRFLLCLVMFLLLLGSATTAEAEWRQTAVLIPDESSADRFEHSVAIDDGILVVGAIQAGEEAGSVYVYGLVDGVWSEQALLTANDAADYYSGSTIAIHNGTVAVGGFRKKDNGSAGAVHVYVQDENGSWTEQATLMTSNRGRFLGQSLAIQGTSLIAGAPLDDDDYNDDGVDRSGAVYVFTHESGSWTERSKLTVSDGSPMDNFGFAVSIHGDWLVVGSPNVHTTFPNKGSAYLFHKVADGSWTEEAKLTASDGQACKGFGQSVDIFGDTVAVGSPGQSGLPGTVYIFMLSRGEWTEHATLVPNDIALHHIAITGYLALDDGRLVVGTSIHEPFQAYLFVSVDGSWTEQAHLTANDSAANDLQAFAVAFDKDTVVVGSCDTKVTNWSFSVFSDRREPAIAFPVFKVGFGVAMLLSLAVFVRHRCNGRRQRADRKVYERMESYEGDHELTVYQPSSTDPLMMSHPSPLQHRHRQG